jgi:DNA-binding NtrC family response regulator
MKLLKEKILIVDDETDFLDTYSRVFTRLGFSSLTAEDAPQAIELIEREHPGLVVTDLSLPRGDGFQVTRCAREQLPPIPVIIITAYHTFQMAKKAQEEGAASYLPKPFSNRDLVEAVRKALMEAG